MTLITKSFNVATGGACACCGGTPPTGCSCALLIPPFGSPYADYATAAAAVTSAQVSNCVGFCGLVVADYTTFTFTATFTPGASLVMNRALAWGLPPGGGGITGMWASLSLLSSAVVTIAWTAGGDAGGTTGASASLYSCDGTLVETVTNSTGADLVFSPVSADGEYYITMDGGGAVSLFFGSSFVNSSLSVSSAFWVNPVIAQWDDSGTTRNLWACPKLLLPPLTEFTGDWYASCGDASAVLIDPLAVSDCVGYNEHPTGLGSFTATGGSSFSFAVTSGAFPLLGSGPFWGSLNASAGDTLSGSSSDWVFMRIEIYDDSGVLVEDFFGAPTITSSPLPYTGRYSIRVSGNLPGLVTSFSCAVTCSGAMTTNPIQARYDLGLTCAGTLDCGDACP